MLRTGEMRDVWHELRLWQRSLRRHWKYRWPDDGSGGYIDGAAWEVGIKVKVQKNRFFFSRTVYRDSRLIQCTKRWDSTPNSKLRILDILLKWQIKSHGRTQLLATFEHTVISSIMIIQVISLISIHSPHTTEIPFGTISYSIFASIAGNFVHFSK